MRKLLCIGALIAVACISFPTLSNELRSRHLAKHLATAELPSGAQVIDKTHRVFNGGNSDGCDYQGLIIVSYWGDVTNLREAFMASLDQYADQFSDPEIVTDTVNRANSWGAKIMGRSTELHIRPNTDHSGLYLVNLTVAARALNLDLRCM